MGRLIYSAITSLDGFLEDASGGFEWAAPDEEVHAFVNELERPVGAYLYGRRMYETMLFWETVSLEDEPAEMTDFAEIWRAADKIVYSRSLASASSDKTTLERDFVPDAVRRLKESTEDDLTVGGADLAGQAIRAGLVDELQWFAVPFVIGGGKRWLPADVGLKLQLVDNRRFTSGVLYSSYRIF